MKKRISFLLLITFAIQGCNASESSFDKQVKACVNDVKLGLGDPGSLEIISTHGSDLGDLGNGWYQLELSYTAKNAFGGRVRGEATCGFKSKEDFELNPEDPANSFRQLARDLKSMGIR